jgi:hypothetical protein
MHESVRLHLAGAGGSLAATVTELELFTIAAGARDYRQHLGIDGGSAIG